MFKLGAISAMAVSPAFDGATRACVDWKKAKGGVWRCKEFEEGKKHPTCPGGGLKGGGRSQFAIRPGKRCKVAGAARPPKRSPKRTPRRKPRK
jgi:hypothetical protein